MKLSAVLMLAAIALPAPALVSPAMAEELTPQQASSLLALSYVHSKFCVGLTDEERRVYLNRLTDVVEHSNVEIDKDAVAVEAKNYVDALRHQGPSQWCPIYTSLVKGALKNDTPPAKTGPKTAKR
jgi:hypothetical protein